MAVKYKLVERRNPGQDQQENPKKVYAQIVYGDYVSFEEFSEEVSDSSGVGSALTKAVLDRVNVVLVRHLQHGRRVNVGELGTFRYGLGSEGAVKAEDFESGMIREPKVRFLPGKALRTIKGRSSFEKVDQSEEEKKPEGGGMDRPDEI